MTEEQTEALTFARKVLNDCHHYINDAFAAYTALEVALAEQPAHQQEPVMAQSKFDSEQLWGPCTVEHHNLVQSELEKWPGYQTRLLYTSPSAQQQEPIDSIEKAGAFMEARLWEFIDMSGERKSRMVGGVAMNKEDIIRMAQEADSGFEVSQCHEESIVGMNAIERFAKLVAEHICEKLALEAESNGNTILAMQIRARGQA